MAMGQRHHVVKTPERPAGQHSAIGLRAEKMEHVRVGFVGLGMRGPAAVERFTYIPGVEIIALCDAEKRRAEECQQLLIKASMPEATIYSGEMGYEELCKRNDIDLVYIAADWLHHFPIAMCAMENGKHVAIEVPSAMNLKECWDLINMSEKTRLHCMILENCCYDWFEMNTLNMAQQGLFGEIIRAQGAYIHNLDEFWDFYWKKGIDDKLGWRLEYNMLHRGDIYATHGLGPIAQALNIHRGDRMKTLVAMDTESFIGKRLVEKRTGNPCDNFKNGDHTTTLIRTEKGKVIEIQHDVMTPQPYNRLYQLTGTQGLANKYPIEGYALETEQIKGSGIAPKMDQLNSYQFLPKKKLML
jgi:Predicted dehydrogenases and related proteins